MTENAPKSTAPAKPKARNRRPRTISTNVGEVFREAQEAKRAQAAAAMRRIARKP